MYTSGAAVERACASKAACGRAVHGTATGSLIVGFRV